MRKRPASPEAGNEPEQSEANQVRSTNDHDQQTAWNGSEPSDLQTHAPLKATGNTTSKSEAKPLHQTDLAGYKLRLERTKVALLAILVALALGAFIYAASTILIPITMAALFAALLSPLVDFAKRWRIPSYLSAGVIVFCLLGTLISAIFLMAEPASRWVEELPSTLREVKSKMSGWDGPMDQLREVSKEVGELTTVDKGNASDPIPVEIEEKTWLETVVTTDLPVLTSYIVIIVFLTYFLLSARDHILRQVATLASTWRLKRRLVEVITKIRQDISRYLATVALINLGLAIVVSLVLWLYQIPNPWFWGILAGLFNFAPYVGAIMTMLMLTLVAATTFDTLASALLVPGTFLIITVLEGQLITPTVVGHQLKLNPTAVFLSVIFWSWLWGIPGALMAAPILASLNILFDNLSILRKLGRWQPIKGPGIFSD